MTNVLKKWIAAVGGMRLIVVFVYVFVSLTINLNHTCEPVYQKNLNYQQKFKNHQWDCDTNAENGSVFYKSSLYDENRSDQKYCIACLYSRLSQLYKLSPKISPVIVKLPAKIQLLHRLSIYKKIEYLTSILLRAPPKSIS